MKHDISCLRKLHRYSKKYPCNCLDGSDKDKNWITDREAEYVMRGYGRKEAKKAAKSGRLDKPDESYLETLGRISDQRASNLMTAHESNQRLKLVADEYQEWIIFYNAGNGSYTDFLKSKSLTN